MGREARVRFRCASNKSRKQISVIAVFRQHLSAAVVVSLFSNRHTEATTPCNMVAVAAVIDASSIGGLPRSKRSKTAGYSDITESDEFVN